MSHNTHGDPESGNNADGNHAQSVPSEGASGFGDSSGPFFSIYSKAAEEEDNKMVERWQKDADGILIFTGLFSAAVAALLSVTVLDLKPNSQDTSAFYLGNIYEFLADPNVTRGSLPTRAAKPPPFSPPRHAVWVNLLWFLSLVMGLTCALLATSLHQWARRYIHLTQPARCSPEKRARMRAFFANGVDKMHIPWAVEALPTLLHLSLFFFFGGLVIYLFNVDQEVFTYVALWIGLFSMVYGLITLLPLIRQDSPYYAPLSMPTWLLYTSIQYLIFKLLAFITSGSYGSYQSWERYRNLRDRYHRWMLGGVEKRVEETVSEQSSEIDIHILGWTISALGNDESLEEFFEAIPGLFNSKLVKHLERDFPVTLLKTFWGALDGFMGRTLSSNSVKESVKSRRVSISRDVMSMIPCSINSMQDNLRSHFDQVPVSIERSQAMIRWFARSSDDISYTARIRAAENLARMEERDGRWIALASKVYGSSEQDLQRNVALGGDNVLLATLIDVSRRVIRSHEFWLVGPLTQFDIRRTLPRLQRDFCTLWNELVQEAEKQERYIIPSNILRLIHPLHNALHQGTATAPTAFSTFTRGLNPILLGPWSYPLCDFIHLHITNPPAVSITTEPGVSPDASPYPPSHGGSAVRQQGEQINILVEPPSPSDPTTNSEIGGSSQASIAALLTNPDPIHSSPTGTSPTGGVVSVSQDAPAASFRPLEGATHRDIVASCAKAEPDIREIMPAPAPTLAPVPASTPPIPNNSSTSCDAGASSASNPLLPPSSVIGFSTPASPSPSHVPPFSDSEFLTLLCSTAPSCPPGNAILPRLRARGLVNSGSICFANAVLQLLVHSHPFWNLFRVLGEVSGHRGAGGPGIGGGATPLVDATVRLVEEFMFKEPPPTQQSPQQAGGGNPMGDKEAKIEPTVVDSFEPTYLYDAMKKKRQLKDLLAGQQQDAAEFFCLYLDALDKELLALLNSISVNKPGFAASEVEEREMSQLGPSEVEKGGMTANFVESPMMRIFGGKSCSSVRAPNQSDSITKEVWRSLQLDIRPDSVHTVQDALAHISQPQSVQVGPSGLVDASQQVPVEVLPPVLVLHLKRFQYDATAGGAIKFGKSVQFFPELEIPLDIMVPAARQPAEQLHYKLFGALYHHGESACGGHYSVDVLDPNGDDDSGEAWLHIDDEEVSTVRREAVFGGHDNERVDDRCIYMLFYCRTAPTHT